MRPSAALRKSPLPATNFLYLALASPHTPIVPSSDWQGKSGLGKQGDFVMQTDWALGQVMSAPDHAGIADSVLFIFTSDNHCTPAADVGKLEKPREFSIHETWNAQGWECGGKRSATPLWLNPSTHPGPTGVRALTR